MPSCANCSAAVEHRSDDDTERPTASGVRRARLLCDGGGLDKPTLENLGRSKAGDCVRIEWASSELRRIECIAKAQ